MAEVKVVKIKMVEERAFMGNDKTTFEDGSGQEVYTFGKVAEGESYDGVVTADKAGKMQFKKTPTAGQTSYAPRPSGGRQTGSRTSPDERDSIERQVALKGAIEVVRDFSTLTKPPTDLEEYCKEVKRTTDFIYKVIKSRPTGFDPAEQEQVEQTISDIFKNEEDQT